jgi:hypothetical protein
MEYGKALDTTIPTPAIQEEDVPYLIGILLETPPLEELAHKGLEGLVWSFMARVEVGPVHGSVRESGFRFGMRAQHKTAERTRRETAFSADMTPVTSQTRIALRQDGLCFGRFLVKPCCMSERIDALGSARNILGICVNRLQGHLLACGVKEVFQILPTSEHVNPDKLRLRSVLSMRGTGTYGSSGSFVIDTRPT